MQKDQQIDEEKQQKPKPKPKARITQMIASQIRIGL
jgi:hypothetical protein